MPLLRTLLLAALPWAAAACSDPFIEIGCDGNLELVVKGEARGDVVDVESLEVKGAVEQERFHVSFPSPLLGIVSDQQDLLLEFGYNPLVATGTGLSKNLQSDMQKWFAHGSHRFQVTNRDVDQEACEVIRGTLCGRLGVDPNGDGSINTEQTDAERFHRLESGWIEFSDLDSEGWRASFEVRAGHDEGEPTMLGGPLSGCFRASLHRLPHSSESRYSFQ